MHFHLHRNDYDFLCWHLDLCSLSRVGDFPSVFHEKADFLLLPLTFLNIFCVFISLASREEVEMCVGGCCETTCHIAWGILRYLNKWSVSLSFADTAIVYVLLDIFFCLFVLSSRVCVVGAFPECNFSTLRVIFFLSFVFVRSIHSRCFGLSATLPFSSWENFLCLCRNVFTIKKEVSFCNLRSFCLLKGEACFAFWGG